MEYWSKAANQILHYSNTPLLPARMRFRVDQQNRSLDIGHWSFYGMLLFLNTPRRPPQAVIDTAARRGTFSEEVRAPRAFLSASPLRCSFSRLARFEQAAPTRRAEPKGVGSHFPAMA